MDVSEPTVDTTADSTPPVAEHWLMSRALASAAVFGGVGYAIGRWLGRDLKNKIAEPVLKWSMASFWALIAAYSSLKASDLSQAMPHVPVANAAEPEKMMQAQPAPKVKTPLSLIEVDTLKDEGMLQPAPHLQRA